MNFFNLKFEDDNLIFIDQTKLPFSEEYIRTDSYVRIAEAIKKLEIRGAPAIGIAAGYALALSIKNDAINFYSAFDELVGTRPTAVNLSNVLLKIKNEFQSNSFHMNYKHILSFVQQLHADDINKCNKIAQNGSALFKGKVSLIHHCNTGYLAATGPGTALSVIFKLNELEKIDIVYVDETRPLLQGSRLTAYELSKNNINFKVITDSMAAHILKTKKVDAVITGADRIALNGDSANKIGTYSLAIAAKYHNIPFYIAAPDTTIDINSKNGNDFIIEERDPAEIYKVNGIPVTKDHYHFLNPAFDVTTSDLITAIITDNKVYYPPFDLKND